MTKIVKENGIIWGVEETEHYGVKHISRFKLGEYKLKPKKNKKEDEN